MKYTERGLRYMWTETKKGKIIPYITLLVTSECVSLRVWVNSAYDTTCDSETTGPAAGTGMLIKPGDIFASKEKSGHNTLCTCVCEWVFACLHLTGLLRPRCPRLRSSWAWGGWITFTLCESPLSVCSSGWKIKSQSLVSKMERWK